MTLDEVQKLVTIGATVSAPVLAILGFRSWRRELHGRSRFEVARKLLLGALSLRDEIRAARSPFMGAAEWEGRPKKENETSEERRTRESAYAYSKRMEKVFEALRSFHLTALEARVLWSAKIQALTQALEDKVGDLHRTLLVYFMHPSPPPNVDERSRFERVIFGGRKEDEFGQEVDNAVDALESFLRRWIGK